MASEGKKPARRGRIRPWAVALWLLVWQGASMAIDQQILLVSPVRVVVRLLEMALTAELWTSIGFSLLRIGAGVLLAAALGVGLAALSARFSRVEELLAPAMLAIQSVPVASFIILALIWFSSRSLSVLISILMVLPVLYANTLGGIRAADAQLLEMAQVFRIPAARRVRYVYLPQVLPYFRSACQAALGLCWKAGIAAEVICRPQFSMGRELYESKIYLEMPDLFAWTIAIILLSMALEQLFRRLLARRGT